MWTHAEGLITSSDISVHLDAEARDHGVDLPELVDARAASTDITPSQVRQLVNQVFELAREHPFGPTAIVATNDVAFGMARMFSMLVERFGVTIEVFRDRPAAEAWLDQVGS